MNVDYLLYGIISCFMRPFFSCLIFVVFLAVDVVMSAKGIFYFDVNSVAMSMSQINLIQIFQSNLFILTSILAILLTSVSYFISRFFYRNCKNIKFMVIAIVVVLGLDVINGTNGVLPGSIQATINLVVLPGNIGTSQIGKLAFNLTRKRKIVVPVQINSASETRLIPNQGAPSNDHKMLIVVESWGVSDNPLLNSIPLSRLLVPSVLQRYDVNRGRVPFSGATTRGEMREFCGIRASFTNAIELGSANCLPGRFASAGYETYAFHGFAKAFLKRQEWFPLVGFEHLNFGDDTSEEKCGIVFRGECDTNILSKIASLMRERKNEKTFVYYLTLNTHLPNSPKLANKSPASCDGVPTQEICTLLKLHEEFFAALGRILVDPTVPPMQVLLVGDHAPPFAALKSRKEFSTNEVPFLELVPK